MSEKICGTCKHWEPEGTPHHFTGLVDEKPHVYHTECRWHCHKDGQKIGQCKRAEQTEKGSGPLMVATCHSEGIYGDFVTDERFSCVLWEQK